MAVCGLCVSLEVPPAGLLFVIEAFPGETHGNYSSNVSKQIGCDAPFTVRNFLLECGDFAQVRNNCFHVENMKQ